MKIYFTTSLVVCLLRFAEAQEIPDIEFSHRLYYLKGSTWENFERTTGSVKTKVKALGYGGAESFVQLDGPAKSTLRFPAAAIPIIAIKIDDNTDPSEIIICKRLEIRKESRIVPIARKTLVTKLENHKDDVVKVSIKKIKDKIYQVIFDEPLAPGEYSFAAIADKNSSASPKVSCFGID